MALRPLRRAEPLGLVRDLPIEVYHADRAAISCSGLLQFARSPWHFFAQYLHPDAALWRKEETAAQRAGNLVHCLALEPERFAQRYAVGPDDRRSTNKWKAFEEECRTNRLRALKRDELATARMQAEALRRQPILAPLLEDPKGESEVSAYAEDPITGVRVRVRPDRVSPIGDGTRLLLVDVKTVGVGMAKPAAFRWQVRRMGYDVQAALYSDFYALAASRRKPHTIEGFVFGAVEGEWPFAASACMLTDESLQRGRERYRALLDAYARCRASGEWPCYGDDVSLIDVPPRYDEDLPTE